MCQYNFKSGDMMTLIFVFLFKSALIFSVIHTFKYILKIIFIFMKVS